MQEFVEFTLGGVAFGMIYAAIALALVLIWRGTRILNYSQGGMAMFTTYVALIVINHTGNYWEGFVLALISGLVLGAVLERLVVRHVENKPPLNAVVVTIGLLIFLEGLAGIMYGGQFRSFPPAFSIVGLTLGSTALGISRNDVFTAAAVLAAALLLAALFRFTAVGLRLRATAFDANVARLLGVRIGRVLTLGWALAGLIGALAGVLVSPQTFLYPNSMDSIFVLGFTAAVIGGLESPVGAVVGGVLLGVVLNLAGGYLGSDLVPLFGLAVLVLVLMVRPSGLFSTTCRPAGVIMTLARHAAAALLLAVVLLILTIKLGPFRDFQLAEVAAYVTAVAGLTYLIGLSGQVSLGNGALMAIGAYAAALLLMHLHWPLELIFVASAAFAAVAGGIIGMAAARLRGPYLAGATLMLAVALPSVADKYAGVFGGDQGLTLAITTPGWLGATFPPTRWLAWITCAAALITLVLLANLGRSRIGRSWRALRDNEIAASLSGLNVARMQVLAFVVSAACAGLGGALTRGRHVHRVARRLHAHAVDQPAHRGDTRRPRQPGRARCGAASCSSSCPPTCRTWPPATGCPARQARTSRSRLTASCSSS